MWTLAKLSFGTPNTSAGEPVALVSTYLNQLWKNGQIGEHYLIRDRSDEVEAYILTPARDSLDSKFNNEYASKSYIKIQHQFGKVPTIELLEKTDQRQNSEWIRASYLYIDVEYLNEDSDFLIWIPEVDEGVPLYLLPIPTTVKDQIIFWSIKYKALYEVWLCGGTLEMEAYKELSSPSSDLNKTGLEFCNLIAKAICKPCYLHILNYYQPNPRDDVSLCPLCRGKRILSKDGCFDFLCETCGIVANQGAGPSDTRPKGSRLSLVTDET